MVPVAALAGVVWSGRAEAMDSSWEPTGEGEHLISQEDAFRLTEVCLKARNAAESGQWTDV